MGVSDCVDCDKKKAEVDCNCIPVIDAEGVVQPVVLGCTDSTAANYDPLANCDDGSCIELISGCMDPTALNYSTCYNADCAGVVGGTDTSCCCSIAGCTDPTATNYNAAACLDDGSCDYPGCTNNTACNYNSQATTDDGSCEYPTSASSSASACGSYTWSTSGQTYTASGTYTSLSTNAGGCIHTDTLNLIVNTATNASSSVSECTSYTWPINGTTYTTAGTYTDVGTNANGCDHTENLTLTLGYAGCTDATAQNYDPGACESDGSCVAQVLGCTCGGGSLPSWNSAIGDGGPNTGSTWAALYGISDPAQAAGNYNAQATQEDGTCTFCIYGCMTDTSCNYNSAATCDDGSCTPPAQMDLGTATYAVNSPNKFNVGANGVTGGNCSCSCLSYGMSAYWYETGVQAYGAHVTKGITSQTFDLDLLPSGNNGNHTGGCYTESYFFMIGHDGVNADTVGNTPLVPTQTYCITWVQLVSKLNNTNGAGVCSDCLMGGWGVKIDNNAYTTADEPSMSDLNTATSIYDPVHLNDLTFANALYHNSECGTNDAGNSNGKNSAGAPNGSHSEWEEKCITFTATETEHTIHFYAITDFNQCLGCYCNSGCNQSFNTPPSGPRGAYVGISHVNIDTDCAGAGDCVCT